MVDDIKDPTDLHTHCKECEDFDNTIIGDFNCISCGKLTAYKVLYAGIPAKWCSDAECSTLWGFWSIIITWLPFNGNFFIYNSNYFVALYYWLTTKSEDLEDL